MSDEIHSEYLGVEDNPDVSSISPHSAFSMSSIRSGVFEVEPPRVAPPPPTQTTIDLTHTSPLLRNPVPNQPPPKEDKPLETEGRDHRGQNARVVHDFYRRRRFAPRRVDHLDFAESFAKYQVTIGTVRGRGRGRQRSRRRPYQK